MKVMAVILAMSLIVSGCSMAFTPTKRYLFHPRPLVEAEQAVEQAQTVGKDKQCPAEFNSAQNLVDKAYQIYWDCKDNEAILMAGEALIKATALCPPPPPMPEIKPEAKPEVPTPMPPPPAPLAAEEPKEKKPEIKIELPPTPKPKTFIFLWPIRFEFDKAFLTEEAKKNLKINIKILKKNPKAKVRIEGYACSHGTDEYNMTLSERRVKTATEYLVKNGIAADRLSSIAFGETEPLLYPIPENPTPYNKNSEAMKMNRRVDFELIW